MLRDRTAARAAEQQAAKKKATQQAAAAPTRPGVRVVERSEQAAQQQADPRAERAAGLRRCPGHDRSGVTPSSFAARRGPLAQDLA